jgi:hypothetical protein
MKPPRFIYLLLGLTLAGLIANSVRIASRWSGIRNQRLIPLVVMLMLAAYFAYFVCKRVKYDWISTRPSKEFLGKIMIEKGATVELYRVESRSSIKVKIRLACRESKADEHFPIKILDKAGGTIFKDSFVPVFGDFRIESQFDRKSFPLRILITNESESSRCVEVHVNYSEVI